MARITPFMVRAQVNPDFLSSGEHTEGRRAFLEKRKPDVSRWR